MGFFGRLIIFLAAIVVGIILAKYREILVRTLGKNELAEKYLGSGGSYTFWQLFGILLIIGALIYLVG